MIADYLDQLSGGLGFDPELSRRVREEVEDHLREAVAADPADDRCEAEARAIARFGDPLVIAGHFAVGALGRQTRNFGAVILLAIAGIYIVMKARVAFYALTAWPPGDDMQALASAVVLIDGYAFRLSLLIGLLGFAYISAIPDALHSHFRSRLRWFCLICAAATMALAISIASDGILTALRMVGTDVSLVTLVPIASMAVEIAGAAALGLQIRAIWRRLAALQNPPPAA
jgi:hypothetical protein